MVTLSSSLIVVVIAAIIVFFPPARVNGLGSASTIAVSYGSNTVCGILAGKHSQKIQCYQRGRTFSIQPNISYEAISGGLYFFCGLSSGGTMLHCWETGFSSKIFHGKRLYHNATFPLFDLNVGESQVCALQAISGRLQCWGNVRSQFSLSKMNRMAFVTITSGGGFSCGIVKDAWYVLCWGENGIGDYIETQFGNMSMFSLVAGKSHVCGLTMSGILICKGSNEFGQLDAPPNAAFEYSGIALGAKHSCATKRESGKVVCWGGGVAGWSGFMTDGIESLSFESIVAGLDFTCGLTRENLTTVCWGPGWPHSLGSELPLSKVIPGPCVEDTCGICGIYTDSEALCSDNANICKKCVIQHPLSALHDLAAAPETRSEPEMRLAPSPISQSPTSQLISSSTSPKAFRPYWPYEIFGSVGILSGIWALVYCIKTKKFSGASHRKTVQDSSEPDSEGKNGDPVAVTSNASSAPHSRSSTITQSSSQMASRERSLSSLKHIDRAKMFSLLELVAATKNFSVEHMIGSGSFGIVYKGKLADGREVAIKREEIATRKRKFAENDTAFDSELALLSRVHHKHLVGLVGFCQEKDERLLVYEYMSNGSLHGHLHGNNIHQGSSKLNSWRMRIKIALDAARGIEYVHNYAVPPIIHRDIKSSNILLDSNWTARVSDFGLSLMGPGSDQEELVDAKAVGTVGYIDPEYYVLKVLTTKSDVYGFGVVLLELLTGKRAVFKNAEDTSTPMGVVEYAGPFILAGEVWKVLDRRVGQRLMFKAEAVELVAYTALRCVNLEGKLRPSMSEVVANLERAFAICEDDHTAVSSFPLSVPFS
ncbi:hypothetical protein Ancab_011423 [Ancistrocladus abbreviatus]